GRAARTEQIPEQVERHADKAGGNAGIDPAHRNSERRRNLLAEEPGELDTVPCCHEADGDREQDDAPRIGGSQLLGEKFHLEMRRPARRDDGRQEGRPEQEIARQLLGPRQSESEQEPVRHTKAGDEDQYREQGDSKGFRDQGTSPCLVRLPRYARQMQSQRQTAIGCVTAVSSSRFAIRPSASTPSSSVILALAARTVGRRR